MFSDRRTQTRPIGLIVPQRPSASDARWLCTVLIDGKQVNSCLTLLAKKDVGG
jgi:hypothetical protein